MLSEQLQPSTFHTLQKMVKNSSNIFWQLWQLTSNERLHTANHHHTEPPSTKKTDAAAKIPTHSSRHQRIVSPWGTVLNLISEILFLLRMS